VAKRLPDEREAVEGAKVASATAAGLLKDADLLAGAGRCGRAVSLAVLGFEEAVKARTLGAIAAAASVGQGPGLSDDSLRKIIYGSHRERHAAGFVQHVAAAFPRVYGELIPGCPVSPEDSRCWRNWRAC
jgi:AbiV family abortive infection protein